MLSPPARDGRRDPAPPGTAEPARQRHHLQRRRPAGGARRGGTGGEEWVVSVRDDGVGVGIDPHDHDDVFTVFNLLHNQEESEGTGIGLALCERIVENHGGDILVDSEPGEGTTFSFTLPAVGD